METPFLFDLIQQVGLISLGFHRFYGCASNGALLPGCSSASFVVQIGNDTEVENTSGWIGLVKVEILNS